MKIPAVILMLEVALFALVGCRQNPEKVEDEVRGSLIKHFEEGGNPLDKDYLSFLVDFPRADLSSVFVASINRKSLEREEVAVYVWWIGTLEESDEMRLVPRGKGAIQRISFRDVSDERGVRQGEVPDERIFDYLGLVEVELSPQQRAAVAGGERELMFSRNGDLMMP